MAAQSYKEQNKIGHLELLQFTFIDEEQIIKKRKITQSHGTSFGIAKNAESTVLL